MKTRLDIFASEPYKDGDIVEGVFTNSGNVRLVIGEIVGKTKNYWKVKATIRSPYANEPLGRVFQVETPLSRKWSANNRILGKVEESKQPANSYFSPTLNKFVTIRSTDTQEAK